ncbi:hypothetical protein EW145_g3524 [Phellinidium pouzarii]|uniref:Mitochondrial carrier n=1 Tax=Phellinidium pouzarii TaxID=167371 RepID=A0A4S4L7A6_9AGAM|nr:hypothetical protein EW145_g3524 [Phellinidium pouzarii]
MSVGQVLVLLTVFMSTFVVSFLVAVPLAGTLVRFRANYTPKGLQLDGEGGVQPHTGPVVNSYFAMLKRVKRLEGWSGFYRGFTTERKRPWTLFLTPGLLVSEVLRIAYINLLMDPLRMMILPAASDEDQAKPFANISVARLSIYLGLVFISLIIICPLEVISTRLSIQRNHAHSGFSIVGQDEVTDVNDVVYSASDEDVIGLRPDDDPYTGFMDCVKRIVDEEGSKTLFRAWWLIFIPLLSAAFVP